MDAKTIKIGFVGDLCLAMANTYPVEFLDQNLALCTKLNDGVDLSVANHEFCISTSQQSEENDMLLRPQYAAKIAETGFDVFCLANNHIGDFGSKTLLNTKNTLEGLGCMTVGVGENKEEATKPLYIEKNGLKISIINYCDATQYAAGKSKAGLAHLEKKLLLSKLAKAKQNSDISVVLIHSDLEFTNYPAPWRVALSREIAEHGADIIIHHHPHTLQGIEYHQGSLIAYSLGNFIFQVHGMEYMEEGEGFVEESLYLNVNVSQDEAGDVKISHDITPVIIQKNNITAIADPAREQNIREKMMKYSSSLDNSQFLETVHFEKCRNQMKMFLGAIYYKMARKEFKNILKHLKVHFRTKAHTRWMRGFFTFGKY